jgi:ectoine hydroxylase-related dioxygenase (phytanoyl-CoA dioxygenase family)
MDEGGETYFIQTDFIKGVSFVPGRMVLFDSNIMHKATSFRNKDRYTIALKFKSDNILK